MERQLVSKSDDNNDRPMITTKDEDEWIKWGNVNTAGYGEQEAASLKLNLNDDDGRFRRSNSADSTCSSTHTSYQDLPSTFNENFSARLTQRFDSAPAVGDNALSDLKVKLDNERRDNNSYKSKHDQFNDNSPTLKYLKYPHLFNNEFKSSFKDDINEDESCAANINNSKLRRGDLLSSREFRESVGDIHNSRKKYSSKSAFESDPDVVQLNLKNNALKLDVNTSKLDHYHHNRHLSPNLGGFLSPVEHVSSGASSPSSAYEFDPGYLNIFSLKIKKEGIGTKEIGNDDGDQPIATRVRMDALNDTIESSHLDSDHARGPVFPSEVYGTRPNANSDRGIYSNKNKSSSSIRIGDGKADDMGLLDEDSLKLMDRKLKKLMRKSGGNSAREDKVVNSHASISWDIPLTRDKQIQPSQDETLCSLNQTDLSDVHSSVPLKAAPSVHDKVKKLRHEFENDGDVSSVPRKLNQLFTSLNSKSKTVQTEVDQETGGKKKEQIVQTSWTPAGEFSSKPDLNIKGSENEKQTQDNKPGAGSSKSKLQEIIQSQKLKHENRIRALEKLIKLERLKALKLQRIMMLNQNENANSSGAADPSTAPSFIYESILNENETNFVDVESMLHSAYNASDTTCLDNLQQFEASVNKHLNAKLTKTAQPMDKKSDSEQQPADINNINNNQVRDLIDREDAGLKTPSPSLLSSSSSSSTSSPSSASSSMLNLNINKHEQYQQRHSDFDYNQRNFNITNQPKHLNRPIYPTVNNKNKTTTTRSKFTWFYPIEKVNKIKIDEVKSTTNDENEFISQFESLNVNRDNDYEHELDMSRDRYLEYDRCKQMSLQEAFRIFKYNVILNSRKRVRDIKAKEAKRQVETELKLNDFKMLQKKLHSMNHHHYHGRLRQSSSSSSSNFDTERRKKYEYFTIVPPASKSRNMTHKEIKDQTKKNYQKLPEVQQKKLREKLEENKICNGVNLSGPNWLYLFR